MNVYILIYTHRHGVDVFPVAATRSILDMPDPFDWLAARNVDVEPDRDDEFAEWGGPFQVEGV